MILFHANITPGLDLFPPLQMKNIRRALETNWPYFLFAGVGCGKREWGDGGVRIFYYESQTVAGPTIGQEIVLCSLT